MNSWLEVLRSDAYLQDKLAEESETTALRRLMTLLLKICGPGAIHSAQPVFLPKRSKPFASIGRELDLSKDRVRQLEARALGSLRNFWSPAYWNDKLW